MPYARVQDGFVAEIIADGAPLSDRFTPDVAAALIRCGTDVREGWTYDGKVFTPFVAPPPDLAILKTALVTAARASCDAITAQVVPDQTHRDAYTNAANMVGPEAKVPDVDPGKTAFAGMATAFGFSDPQTFATLVVEIAAASLTLSAILTTLQGAALTAKNTTDLIAALSAFETAISAFVTNLNAAGLTIPVQDPPAIRIVGLNA